MAPPPCTSCNLVSKPQLAPPTRGLRMTSAIFPVRLPIGNGTQASPSVSSVDTANKAPETAPSGRGPLPVAAPSNGPSPTLTDAGKKVRSLNEAPTPITDGAVAGEPIVFGSPL